MHPLPAHTIQLVLQYISPLSDPLPLHLVSTPLRQRHHFLQLSPSSPLEYLCWPDPGNARTIDLLDRLPPWSDQPSFPIRYTSDAESTFAHVQISSELRILFHLDDNQHDWKYHDLRLMPFPSASCSTLQELLTTSVPEADADRPDGGDDTSYWDAYGAVEHDLASPLPLQRDTDAAEGEDAYWAQYASVQGSADSTVPSPLPVHRKLQVASSIDGGSTFPYAVQNEPVIDIPVDAIHPRDVTSKLGPPSPNTLAYLLSMISPRKDSFPPVLDDPDAQRSPSACSTDPSLEQTTADSELVTPPMPSGYLDAEIVSPVALKLNGVPLSACLSQPQAEEIALSDSIRGLYHLWKAGRKGEPDEKDRTVFLRIVRGAIGCE